jgi:hypothetical protein
VVPTPLANRQSWPALWLACLALIVLALAPRLALAQEEEETGDVASSPPRSILPEGEAEGGAVDPWAQERVDDGVFTIAVFGDSLAQGIWGSLYRTLQRDDRFEVLNRTRHSTGIARPDYYDWQAQLEQFLVDDPIDAAVFSLGLNDMQGMYVPDGSPHQFRSEAWDEAYQDRVGQLIQTLLEEGVPTYWVGLPIMRSGNYSRNIEHLNTFFAALTDEYDIPYVATWEMTTDDTGAYSSYLPDETGRTRLMRANDGIHFTPRGYDIIGDAVLERMAQDLEVFQQDESE